MKVFGVGTGKSGTTSLAAMFQPCYRSEHEAEPARIVPVAAAAVLGHPDRAEIRSTLLDRDARLRLEVDVAGFLNPLVEDLVGLFPDAQFVLTVRDCFGWLESRIGQRVRMIGGVMVANHLREAQLQVYDEPYADDDAHLADLGLPSTRGLLHNWADANARVLEAVPPERLLVIRTEDMDAAMPTLAAFAGVPAERLQPARSNVRPPGAASRLALDPRRLIERAEEHCSPLMERFWGAGWRELATG